MRVNRNGIIFHGASGFRQKHREGDEGKRLPKLRNFKPDEQGDKTATRGGEESADGALLVVVSQACQLGGLIEHGTKNKKRREPHSHMNIRSGSEEESNDDDAKNDWRHDVPVLDLANGRCLRSSQ